MVENRWMDIFHQKKFYTCHASLCLYQLNYLQNNSMAGMGKYHLEQQQTKNRICNTPAEQRQKWFVLFKSERLVLCCTALWWDHVIETKWKDMEINNQDVPIQAVPRDKKLASTIINKLDPIVTFTTQTWFIIIKQLK